MRAIDLNADLGESFGNFTLGRDSELIPLLTSAHLACGFHGGDPRVMDRTVRACQAAGVAVGAHPSFPDLVGFGRRTIAASGLEVETDVLYQVAALDGFCRRHGVRMQHVKPHGALYLHANEDDETAKGIVSGIGSFDASVILVCQPNTKLDQAAREAGLTVAREGFVDRAYNPDGTLVSRTIPGSVHHDPARVTEQALRMVTESRVVARDGTAVDLEVDTLCVHGDTPDAVQFIRGIRSQLAAAGVELRPMRAVVQTGAA